jgi:hypothetical protein
LSALVQDAQTLKFVPMSSRQEQLAVSQQLVGQQSRQGSLDGLLKALQNLPPATDQTSADLRAWSINCSPACPDVQQLSTAKGVALALANSGAFPRSQTADRTKPDAGPGHEGRPAQTDRATDAGLAEQHQFQRHHRRQYAGASTAELRAQCARHARPGQRQTRAGSFPLPDRLLQSLEGEGDLEQLLRLAAAAVSRLQSHQLSSLEQTGVTDDGRLLSTWQLEIPMRNLQDIVPLQVKFQREEAPEKEPQPNERRDEREPKTTVVARRSGVRHGTARADADSGAIDRRQPVQPTVGRTAVHRRPDPTTCSHCASVCSIPG